MIPKFYPNREDNLHCLQACVKMVLDTLSNKETSWEQIEKGTDFNEGLYSWTEKAALFLFDNVDGVKMISSVDMIKFASEGENYLRDSWTQSWYENQRAHSSEGFVREQMYAKDIVKSGIFEKGDITLDDLENFLKDNLIIALFGPHFVLLYDQDDDNFIFHDPGLPPIKSRIMKKSEFMKNDSMYYFRNEAILIPRKVSE